MNDEEQAMWNYIYKYLEACAPVHWLSWASRCEDPEGKQFMESVLFSGGGLRDLADEHVKREVLQAIRKTPSIMKIVIEDFADEVRKQVGTAPPE